MKVEQVYSLVNDITKEILGDSVILNDDLSNVVDIGTAIFNATDVDNYVKKLVDRIGKVIFVSRPYSGILPSVLMDSWEFGSVVQKISAELPEAQEAEAWNLVDGASYDPNVFKASVVTAKFFNKKVAFEIDMSFTNRQVKESFTSATQLNSFLSMLYTEIEKSMTAKIDGLVMSTVNYMIAATVDDDYGNNDYGASTGIKAINLLKLYNDTFIQPGDPVLTAVKALTTPEFVRFASYQMGLYKNRMARLTKLFNIDGKARFTPADMLHVVLLNDFAMAADAYLQSDTYHDQYTRLPDADVVPYWQGSGTGYDFDDVSNIHITLDGGTEVNVSGVLGFFFDRDALGVNNYERSVRTAYNPKGDFYNNFYEFCCQNFVDPAEQAVVFFIQDPAS